MDNAPAVAFLKRNINLVCLITLTNIVMLDRAKTDIFTDANRCKLRKIAADCFVLLKTKTVVLPLKKAGTIAVAGPLADNKENMPGTWSVAANFDKATSLLTGLKAVAGDKAKFGLCQRFKPRL